MTLATVYLLNTRFNAVLVGCIAVFLLAVVPEIAQAQQFTRYRITPQFTDGASSVYAADLDGDGDNDILSASRNDNKIAWYENFGGTIGSQQIISLNADDVRAVFAADLDGDGDIDVLSASQDDARIAWYENLNGTRDFSEQKVISNSAFGALDVFAADIDGDGDIDVLSASGSDDKIAWYENGGTGAFSSEKVITNSADDATGVFAVDIDGDDDLDILSASFRDDTIAWYENLNGDGSFSSARVISSSVDGAIHTHATDLDGDGDVDVVAAAHLANSILWFENTDGTGTFSAAKTISTTASGAYEVYATDLDGDNDPEVLSATFDNDAINIYDNQIGESGADADGFGPTVQITTNADGADEVYASDLDGDGDADILSASRNDDTISYFENRINEGFGFPNETIVMPSARADGANEAIAVDLNGDGALDIVTASFNDGKLAWHENDGTRWFSPQKVISTSAGDGLDAGDIDGDGDNDLVTTSFDGDTVAWYENTDGAGTFSAANVLSANVDGALSSYLADLDGDGDLDVLAVGQRDDTVYWFENLNGAGSFSSGNIIWTSANGANEVIAADLDGDTDLDVIVASRSDDTVAWFENTDGNGAFSNEKVIIDNALDVVDVHPADLDGDGDVDLLYAPSDADVVNWLENTDGDGSFSDPKEITNLVNNPVKVFTADLNGDGRLDVLTASSSDDKIAWYVQTESFGVIDFGDQAVISTAADRAQSVFAADLDDDGDPDVLASSSRDDEIAWYENPIDFDTPEELFPFIVTSPEAIDFDGVEPGESATETLTIENTGDASLDGEVSLSDDDGVFSLASGSGAFALAPGESQAVEVVFAPEAVGTFTGTVAVSHNADNASNPVEVGLTGLATVSPVVAVTPEAVDFGSTVVGASQIEALTVENTGSGLLEGTISLSQEGSALALTAGEGDFSLASGETQEVEVTFAPGESASFAGTVAIEHNASNASSPVDVSLTGNGIAPAIAVTPEAVNFGSVVTGESATETLTIENTGDASLDGEASLSGDGGVFSLASGSGAFALAPGESQAVEVTFTPGETASFTGNVAIEHNASNASSPVDVGLTGTGTAPAIAVDPAAVDFGSITAGESALQSLTIENAGSAPLEGAVSLSGDAGAFTITGGSGDFSVAPGESQAVDVTFAPEEAASFAGTVAISHNASNAPNPVEVALTGEATVAPPVIAQELPDVELAVGAAAITRDLTQYIEPPATSPGPLTFSASSSASGIATVEVEGSTLRVTPNAVGMATINVTAETEAGGTATLDFLADVNALAVAATRSFGDPRSESSYRLVGLPGQIDEDVAATLSGEAGTAWRVFRETGTTTGDVDDYLAAYDGSEAFRFAPGRGFWMLSRADWAVDTTVGAIELTGDSTTTVPLQEGWNIFSNPLDQPVDWDATLGLPANDGLTETLWQWDGSWSEASRLESARTGEAYYLFNNGGLDALTLQYPAAANEDEALAVTAVLEDAETLRLMATLNAAPGQDDVDPAAVELGAVTIGRASNRYATRQPPAHFMPATFYVEAPGESGADHSESVRAVALSRLLKADVLKTDGPQGMAFDLRLEATSGSQTAPVATGATAHITLPGGLTDDRFAGDEVLLITPDGSRYDLRSVQVGAPIEVTITDEPAELRVLIGTGAFIDEELQVPESLTFGPVYPNPSRGPVTIEVGMPEAADAEIALYDMLGRRVATLHSGELPRGLSEVQWTGDRLASGMYFLRLRSEGRTFTEKVVRVR